LIIAPKRLSSRSRISFSLIARSPLQFARSSLHRCSSRRFNLGTAFGLLPAAVGLAGYRNVKGQSGGNRTALQYLSESWTEGLFLAQLRRQEIKSIAQSYSMRTRETQAGHVGVPRRVDDPSALGGRRAVLVSRASTERDRASRRDQCSPAN
jgi:hypothetical protein